METRRVLEGALALVTGVGRWAGIGAAICRKIASLGGDIFFSYWSQYDREMNFSDCHNDPARIATELSDFGVRVKSLEIDLSEPSSARRLFKDAEDQLGSPAISPQALDKHYAVNVRAVAMLCKEFVKRGNPGCIINMTPAKLWEAWAAKTFHMPSRKPLSKCLRRSLGRTWPGRASESTPLTQGQPTQVG